MVHNSVSLWKLNCGVGGIPGATTGDGTAGQTGSQEAGGTGGAVELDVAENTSAQLSDDTIDENSAGLTAGAMTGFGGGISMFGPGTFSLTAVTIAANDAYAIGGLSVEWYPISATDRGPVEQDSIVANNVASVYANCSYTSLVDRGSNVVYGDKTCPGVDANPRLGSLANNAGSTQTMSLGAGSSAIDLVGSSACMTGADQRGISRPQGAGCDAGAYESAPPALIAVTAALTGPLSATLSGQASPNLIDAKLTVQYGTSTSYGSTTSATDLGSGTSAQAFSVPLSGLQPGTTYHAKVVVTNTDGTASSSDSPFATPAVAVISSIASVASIASGTIRADTGAVQFTCAATGPQCTGKLKLTSHVTTKSGKILAVTASDRKHAKPKRETVGGGSYSIAAGRQRHSSSS